MFNLFTFKVAVNYLVDDRLVGNHRRQRRLQPQLSDIELLTTLVQSTHQRHLK